MLKIYIGVYVEISGHSESVRLEGPMMLAPEFHLPIIDVATFLSLQCVLTLLKLNNNPTCLLGPIHSLLLVNLCGLREEERSSVVNKILLTIN